MEIMNDWNYDSGCKVTSLLVWETDKFRHLNVFPKSYISFIPKPSLTIISSLHFFDYEHFNIFLTVSSPKHRR